MRGYYTKQINSVKRNIKNILPFYVNKNLPFGRLVINRNLLYLF